MNLLQMILISQETWKIIPNLVSHPHVFNLQLGVVLDLDKLGFKFWLWVVECKFFKPISFSHFILLIIKGKNHIYFVGLLEDNE